MTDSARLTDDRPLLPFLVLLFVGSGCAALIYEVVWMQLLSLIVGSNAISMGVILGTFMGGMCLGSLLLSKYVKRSEHPLRVYALLELGIGVFGIRQCRYTNAEKAIAGAVDLACEQLAADREDAAGELCRAFQRARAGQDAEVRGLELQGHRGARQTLLLEAVGHLLGGRP